MNIPSYPLPDNEIQRLSVLAEYGLLDTLPSEDFDRLTNLAARLFSVPIVLISLIDKDRQFFKSRVGIDICETSRDVSFCTHAIVQDDLLFIPDALKDSRFSQNPLVLGPPFIRFYAGQPLITPNGERLGTVCLIDSEPRETFSPDERANLCDLAALIMDRMELGRLDHVRAVSQARFEKIADTSPDAIICSDAQGDITFWNRSAEKIFGYAAKDILNKPGAVIVPDSWRSVYDDELGRLRQGEKLELADRTIELSGLRKDGTEFPAEFSLSTWNDANSISVGAIVRDITDRRNNEERLFRLASLDALTNLSNRAVSRRCLEETLAAETPVAVMLIDLDGFKEVNDTFGHAAGDAVLRNVALQMKSTFPDAVMLARLGGDEFLALLNLDSMRDARNASQRLVKAVSNPYDFAGQLIEVSISIGIALSPIHGETAEEILSAADLALYKAKGAGKKRYELFSETLREVAVARRAFQVELRHAFENGEFELFYQPQVSAHTQTLIGAEALIRWNHPVRGLLTPASFIDVLSKKPSAPAVGEWILKTACAQAVRWQTKVPEFRISVNLFESQLRSPGLISTVKNILIETGLPANTLELEIVENTLLRNDCDTTKILHGLRKLGIGLSFDDYGTGYASLSLLKAYPVNRLKIDQTFVRDIIDDPEDAAMVQAIIYLAKNFGLDVIAEGVETKDQLEYLKKIGCAEIQGYLFGRPIPAIEFTSTFFES